MEYKAIPGSPTASRRAIIPSVSEDEIAFQLKESKLHNSLVRESKLTYTQKFNLAKSVAFEQDVSYRKLVITNTGLQLTSLM